MYTVKILQVLKFSGPHAFHLALVLSGVKPGDWIEYHTPRVKQVIASIEDLIKIGAPLEFLELDKVEHVKTLHFEDFSDLRKRVDPQELLKILSKKYPIPGIKYHNTNISKDIINNLKQSSGLDTPKENILGTTALGRYFGYPDCCIEAYIMGSKGEVFDYTEHRWCHPNCTESKHLQELYKNSLQGIIPDLELGTCFNPKQK